jgi:hypothetical protein
MKNKLVAWLLILVVLTSHFFIFMYIKFIDAKLELIHQEIECAIRRAGYGLD